MVFGVLRVRQRRRVSADVLLELLDELIANRCAITSWWRGELTGSWFRPRSLAALASALRNDVLPSRTPREWHAALKDRKLEQGAAALAEEFARVKRGEHLVASDWESRLDDAAACVRQRLARRRRLDPFIGVFYTLPPLSQTPPSAPRSPAELQRRALPEVTFADALDQR